MPEFGSVLCRKLNQANLVDFVHYNGPVSIEDIRFGLDSNHGCEYRFRAVSVLLEKLVDSGELEAVHLGLNGMVYRCCHE